MPLTLSVDRIRLAIVQTDRSPVLDVFSGAAPAFYNGNDLQFELGFFDANGNPLNLNNVDQVRLQVKPLDGIDGLAVLDATVASGSLNQSMTLDQWLTGDPVQWNALIQFPNAVTQLDLSGADSQAFWLVISAILTTGSFAPTEFTDSFRQRTSNVATLTVMGHSILNGSVADISGAGGSGYNVTGAVLTVVDANNISYVSVGSNEGSTADSTALITITSVPALEATLATGQINVVDSGFNTAPPSLVSTPLYLTAAQSDARYTVSSTKVSKTGDTMSGLLQFSGTTNPGLQLNSLTTTQRNALTPAAGMAVYDTTVGSPMFRMASAWAQPVMSVNGATGVVTFTTDGVTQGSTNFYMTNAGVLAQVLTGLTGTYSAVTAADTVIQAFGKLAAYAAAATGSGSVTSVALAVPAALFTVSGSPVTSAGTLTATLAQQSANTVFAGPTTGSSATPTWRALVAADIPALPESAVTNLTTDLAARLQLAGGTMTGPIKLALYAGGGAAPTPSQGMIAFDTVTSVPMFYSGSAWVDLISGSGSYLPLAGGTLTGALNLVSGTPSGAQATRADYIASTYLPLSGGNIVGALTFASSGSASFAFPNVTTPQRLGITPTTGMQVFDTTAGLPFLWNGLAWISPLSNAYALLISGGTMIGDIHFATVAGAGLVLNQMSDSQMNAITPLTGAILFNGTHNVPYFYSGSAWVALTTSSNFLALSGGTMTGQAAFTGTGYAPLALNPLTTTQRNALTPAEGQVAYNVSTHLLDFYNGSAWIEVGATGSALPLAGGTMTGQIVFTGTTYAPFALNPLTTTQRNALSPAAGWVCYNTTTGLLDFYNGSAWVEAGGAGSAVPLSGGTMTGLLTLASISTPLGFGSGWTVSGVSTTTLAIDVNNGGNQAVIFQSNGGFTQVDMTVGNGNINVGSNTYGFQVAGTQVLGGRRTGWTAATGTATRTSFATGSVTTAALAQAVKALIDDLITHGAIGP